MNPFDGADQGEGESELFDFRFTNKNPTPEEPPMQLNQQLPPVQQPPVSHTPPSLGQNTILGALMNGRVSSFSSSEGFGSMMGPSPQGGTSGQFNQPPVLPQMSSIQAYNGSMFPHLTLNHQFSPNSMNQAQATSQFVGSNLPVTTGPGRTSGSGPEEAKVSRSPEFNVQYIPPSERRRLQEIKDQQKQKRASSEPPRLTNCDDDEDSLVFKNPTSGAATVSGSEERKDSNSRQKDSCSQNSGDGEGLSNDSLDKEPDPKKCPYCQREFKSEKLVEAHFRRVHEKKVKKLEKKLHKKAHEKYKPSKKNKLTLPQFKAQLILDKPEKYGMLKPRFRKELKMLKELKYAEENAYTSDLDVDLSNGDEPNVDNMKENFAKLVPVTHQYFRQFQAYWENIQNGNMKNGLYERFFFDLLLDSPRCEHCLAPLQNNNTSIKNHINYYHFDIDLSKERYSYLDVHKYMQEVYKYPYLIFDNANKTASTVCPIPNCGAQFGKVAKISGQLLIGKQILFADHFVKWHSDEEAYCYGYSTPFFRWILQVYRVKILKQFKHEIQL